MNMKKSKCMALTYLAMSMCALLDVHAQIPLVHVVFVVVEGAKDDLSI